MAGLAPAPRPALLALSQDHDTPPPLIIPINLAGGVLERPE